MSTTCLYFIYVAPGIGQLPTVSSTRRITGHDVNAGNITRLLTTYNSKGRLASSVNQPIINVWPEPFRLLFFLLAIVNILQLDLD